MRPEMCIKKVKRQKASTSKAKLSCMEEHTEGSEWLFSSTHLKVIFREAGHVVLSSSKPHYYLPQRFMYGQA